MIIEVLKEIQERDDLTDKQMGEKLEMHEKSWNRIKNGRSGVSVEFMKQAVRAYPETSPAILQDLFGENWRGITFQIFKEILEEMKSKGEI